MIHRQEWGEEGDGPALLLVHGLGCSTVVWQAAGPLLAGATGRRVVAVDLPGFGRTPPAPGRLSLAGYAGAVAEVASELGGAVVVGNSMGGVVALLAAPSDAVTGLVLLAPALPAGGGGAATLAKFALMATPVLGPAAVGLVRRRRGAERSVDLRLRGLLHRPEAVPPDLRTALVAESAQRPPWASRAYSAATRAIGLEAGRAWALVPGVAVPTLVVHGRHDPLVPVRVLERLRARRPDWHYEVYDGCGHWPQVEQPERLAASVAGWLP